MSDTTHTYTASQWFVPVAAALGSGTGRPSVTGLHGSTAGLALTTLLHPQLGKLGNRSWLIVTRSDETAERLFDDLHFFMISSAFRRLPSPCSRDGKRCPTRAARLMSV